MTQYIPPPQSRATVLSLRELAPGGLYQLEVLAPLVASKAGPGQFVIIQAKPTSARISVPICEFYPEEGRLGMVFSAEGRESLRRVRPGEYLESFMGPVGQPTRIERLGTVVLVGFGVDAFCQVAIARAYAEAGNRVVCLVSGEPGWVGPLAEKLAASGAEVKTEPEGMGLLGRLGELLRAEPVALTLAAGPVSLLRAVREMTVARNVAARLRVSPVMLDGEGLCGGCRVKTGGRVALCCLEGAEFEALELDLDYLGMRQRACKV